jgi:hypothetical protein
MGKTALGPGAPLVRLPLAAATTGTASAAVLGIGGLIVRAAARRALSSAPIGLQ